MFGFYSLCAEPRFVLGRFLNNLRSAYSNQIRTCRQDGCPPIAGAPLSAAGDRKPMGLSEQISINLLRMRTYRNCVRNRSEMNTYEFLDLKPRRMNTYKKTRGGLWGFGFAAVGFGSAFRSRSCFRDPGNSDGVPQCLPAFRECGIPRTPETGAGSYACESGAVQVA